MTSVPPPIPKAALIARWRWWLHLFVLTAYMFLVAAISLTRNKSDHPALSHTAGGLLLVCALELLLFGFVFGLAWLASRASCDDLLLRWRGRAGPVMLGAAYSIGLRVAVGLVTLAVAAALLATRVMTVNSLHDFFVNNRPGIENAVDVAALRDNPAYLWLTLTVVSFVLAGLREELWRSSFLAGLKAIWPRQFGSTGGQVCAVAGPSLHGHDGGVFCRRSWPGIGADHGISPFRMAGGAGARVFRCHQHGADSVGDGVDATTAQKLRLPSADGDGI
jgi:membrane protease YdiL (CAAX protease family)